MTEHKSDEKDVKVGFDIEEASFESIVARYGGALVARWIKNGAKAYEKRKKPDPFASNSLKKTEASKKRLLDTLIGSALKAASHDDLEALKRGVIEKMQSK